MVSRYKNFNGKKMLLLTREREVVKIMSMVRKNLKSVLYIPASLESGLPRPDTTVILYRAVVWPLRKLEDDKFIVFETKI